MESLTLTMAELCAALECGAVVVTGNQRAARGLRGVYRQARRAAGAKSWQPPVVLSWDAWTAEQWRGLVLEGAEERLLLNAAQERMLWREIIRQDKEQSAELSTLEGAESLAEIAAEAWGLLGAYGGRGELKQMAASVDTRAFLRWVEGFELRCKAGGFLSAALLERELLAVAGRLKVGGKILLVGFEGLTPAQAGLVEALSAARGVELQVERAAGEFVAAANEDEELRAAAQWARRVLEERPGARVGVIVPRLEDERAEIDRVLRDVLAPELQDIGAGEAGPYEFSLGGALGHKAMAAAALDLLRWTVGPLPLERVSALLLSPYFGVEAERGARAEFDAFVLRQAKALRPQFELRWMAEATAARLPAVSRLLTAMHRHADAQGFGRRERSYGEWMEEVRAVLRAAEWPGRRAMDSIEFQVRQRWENALDQVATLDFAGERVPFPDCLAELERVARETLFAPESRDAPVQVLGVLESAGSTFDAVWFLRGSDAAWPQTARPHPLLPWSLQSKFTMPGTEPARAQQKSRGVVRRIVVSAAEVVFSYAARNKDGPLHRSPVIAELGWTERTAEEKQEREQVELEEVVDDTPLPSLPDRVTPGGAKVLQTQAACGFRAFAEWRLWSTELESPEFGLDARERGVVAHDVMERFWNAVQTQDRLRSMSEDELDACIRTSVDAAIARARADGEWDRAYIETQRERMTRLLQAWTACEMDRKPFTVVLQEKKIADVRVGPLRLDLRMDRVDRVQGGEILIDYKTGRCKGGRMEG